MSSDIGRSTSAIFHFSFCYAVTTSAAGPCILPIPISIKHSLLQLTSIIHFCCRLLSCWSRTNYAHSSCLPSLLLAAVLPGPPGLH
eukprot:1139778-Pelagomonas_calceolata.AAC.1